MRLSSSPVAGQQYIDKMFEDMPNKERYKNIIDDIHDLFSQGRSQRVNHATYL